jgi:hypothetical protein
LSGYVPCKKYQKKLFKEKKNTGQKLDLCRERKNIGEEIGN